MKDKNDEQKQNLNHHTSKDEFKKENIQNKQQFIFENGNNLNNSFEKNNYIDKDNFMDLNQSQTLSKKNDYLTNNPNIKNDLHISSTVFKKSNFHHHHKKRPTINLTEEEEIYFYNLFESLDTKNLGKLDSIPASSFLKKSGLPRHVLKEIWLIVTKYNLNFITR